MSELKNLQMQAQSLKATIAKVQRSLLERENAVNEKMNTMLEPGILSSFSTFRRLPFYLAPGNVGEINDVVWPYWFVTEPVLVPASSNGAPVQRSFQINAVAGFNLIYMTKTVYQRVNIAPGQVAYEYLNPDDPAGAGSTFGLSYALRDSSSQREFMNGPISLDHVGSPRFPTYSAAPQYYRPNSNLQVLFFNESALDYVVSMQLFGLRVREDQVRTLVETLEA